MINSPHNHADEGGVTCPLCSADQVEGRQPDHYPGAIEQRMDCHACGASWIDVFHLQGYAGLEDADGTSIQPPRDKSFLPYAAGIAVLLLALTVLVLTQ